MRENQREGCSRTFFITMRSQGAATCQSMQEKLSEFSN